MKACPQCAATFPDDASFCTNDGARLQPVPSAAASPAAEGDDAMLEALVAERRSRGGAAQAEPVTGAAKRCPACGRGYAAAFEYCTIDGTPLDGIGAASPPAPPERTTASPVETARPAGRPAHRRGLWGLVLAVVLLLVLGAGYLVTRPPALEGDARAALVRGDLVEPLGASAYDYYQRLAADRPGSAGLTRLGEEALPRVTAELEAFYARWYSTSDAQDRDWDRMQRLSDWAAHLAPDDPRLRAYQAYARARRAFDEGNPAAARSGYRDALAAWPEWALPYNSLGVTYARERDYPEALRWYRQAAERDPSWSFAHSNMGGVYAQLEQWGPAATALRRAVSLDGERAYPHALLSHAYLEMRQYRLAGDAARRALELDPLGASGFDAALLRKRVRYTADYLDGGYQPYMSYEAYVSAREDPGMESGE